MKRCMKYLGLVTGLMLAGTLTANADDDERKRKQGRESIQVADIYMFQPDGPATITPGAVMLVRDHPAGILTATVTSAALEPNTAYSIWWVVFNRPKYCAIPYECAGPDLGNAAVKGSVFWGGGILADGDGYGTTQLELRRGRTDRELFGPMTDTGLRHLKGAEIHLVLRTHGPIGVAGTVAEQIGTANEACPEPDCANKFFSVHRVRQ